MKTQLMPRRNWAIGFWDCFGYTDRKGDNKFVPYFFPMSLFGTCCMVGRVHTLISDEEEVMFGMGNAGLCRCCLTCIPSLIGPFGGCILFSLIEPCQRSSVITKYSVEEEFIVPTSLSCCNSCATSCFYPCSYYQMFVSMQEWEDEEKNHIPQGSRRSHHSNSTINTGPKIYRVFLPTNSVPGKKIEIFLPEADRLVEVVVPSNLPNPIPTGTYIDVSL